jgi:uncharacterized protein (TIGR03032 family)
MTRRSPGPVTLEALWAHHDRQWREPEGVASQWDGTERLDPRLFVHAVEGDFWDVLAEAGGSLVLTREYEHLVVALHVERSRPRISYLRLPHPNGLAVDSALRRLFVASTRNPNLIFELGVARDFVPRRPSPSVADQAGHLLPLRCFHLPGCLYLHDLAFVGRDLHATAVGLNAVVKVGSDGGFRPVWWPACIDGPRRPRFERNYLQLNSIAAGSSLTRSFFTASAARPSGRRPGDLDFPVDGRGVVFSGRTREVVATGLTRPHSLRFHQGSLFVDNSGYGELGRVAEGRFESLCRLPGWSRGLCFAGGVAFVGTSRVIPRFRHYAPGVDPRRAKAGVHAVDLRTGRVLGSLTWPLGNQIFGLELLAGLGSRGFPFSPDDRRPAGLEAFYSRALGSRWPG